MLLRLQGFRNSSPARTFYRLLAIAIVLSIASFTRIQISEAACDPNAPVIRVSVASDGSQANDDIIWPYTIISNDGRFIAFSSLANNLIADDTNEVEDVFVYDRQACTTSRISETVDGTQNLAVSKLLDMSSDGRYLLIRSWLPYPQDSSYFNTFLHDTSTGETTPLDSRRVNEATFSHNGRYVVFQTDFDRTIGSDLWVLDLQTSLSTFVPLVNPSHPASIVSRSYGAKISDDGRYVFFSSDEDSYVSGDTGLSDDIFVKDRQTGIFTRISVPFDDVQILRPSHGSIAISPDGRIVAFDAQARYVDGSAPGQYNVYVRDWQEGITTKVSVSSAGALPLEYSSGVTDISADGRYVVFTSEAANLVSGDTNFTSDVFLHDRYTRNTTMLSINANGIQAYGDTSTVKISADGNFVSFTSAASNLVTGDTNNFYDVFVRSINPLYTGYVVNTADDINDGSCNLTHCSLREAITNANANTSTWRAIGFGIPGSGVKTIQPLSSLPVVGQSITINGASQPGFLNSPVIELDGSLAGAGVNGLNLDGDKSLVRGLAINHFSGSGIQITGDSNRITGSLLGMNSVGDALGNTLNGVTISNGSNSIIGGDTAVLRNVISDNENGILITGVNSSGNQILGNYIGTNSAGTAALGNTNFGVVVSGGAFSNTIGGYVPEYGNLISGNNQSLGQGAGVGLSGTGNILRANKIGTDVSGTLALPNGRYGVWLEAASNSEVGGIFPEAGNIIAFNNGDGVFARDPASSGLANGNLIASNAIFSNTGIGIDLGQDGVNANDTGDVDTGINGLQNFPDLSFGITYNLTYITVRGQLNSLPNTDFRVEFFVNDVCDGTGHGEGQTYIGYANFRTDAAGLNEFSARVNSHVPIGKFITATTIDSNNNTSEFSSCVGVILGQPGPTFTVNNTGDNNVWCTPTACSLREAIIAANANTTAKTIVFNLPVATTYTIQPASPLPIITSPVTIDGTTQAGFTSKPIIELSGALAGAAADGLRLTAPNSSIKALVINRFSAHGITINSGNNKILGNYIGTDVTGTQAFPNGTGNATDGGIYVQLGSNNIIGGVTAGENNLISGNNPHGVVLASSNGRIIGNQIGVNVTGTAALPNDVGIRITSYSNAVGDTLTSSGNVISGNSIAGIVISGNSNLIRSNWIGTDRNATLDLGNGDVGIDITGSWNTIGGSGAGIGNVIAFNQGPGVAVQLVSAAGLGNSILGNNIFANDDPDLPGMGLGIDLEPRGVNPNVIVEIDPEVPETSQVHNFPTLTEAFSENGQIMLAGTLTGYPDQTYRVEFFASNTCDESGHGEGQTFVGAVNVNMDDAGEATIDTQFSMSGMDNKFITATASSSTLRTTFEFSQCQLAVAVSLPDAPASQNFFATGQPTLTWNHVSWAIGYEIQIARDEDFMPESIVFNDPAIPAGQFEITPPALDGGEYFWRVRAKKDAVTWSDWSVVQSFTLSG